MDGDGRYFDHVPLFRRQAGPDALRQDRRRRCRRYRGARRGGPAAGPAPSSPTAIPIAGAPRRRSSSATRRSGSSPWRRTSCARRRWPPSTTRVFVPPQGRNRLYSMIETRPDWCISRQRAWGVPIAVFVNKQTGELLRDPSVVERIAAAFEQEGADAWFASPPARFLGNELRSRRLRAGDGHRRRLVRIGLDPQFRARGQSGPRLAGLALSRRLGPASRLVSFLAAGNLRHPRPGALRRGADPRLRARRAGPQDVEVPGQCRGAAAGDEAVRRRHPAPLGRRLRLFRGSAGSARRS